MIHETAIVHPKAEVGENVEIGAYSIVRENVTIGSRYQNRTPCGD